MRRRHTSLLWAEQPEKTCLQAGPDPHADPGNQQTFRRGTILDGLRLEKVWRTASTEPVLFPSVACGNRLLATGKETSAMLRLHDNRLVNPRQAEPASRP
jgi:hypothetical protein